MPHYPYDPDIAFEAEHTMVDQYYRSEQRSNLGLFAGSVAVLGAAELLYTTASNLEPGLQMAKYLFMLAGSVGLVSAISKATWDKVGRTLSLRRIEESRYDTN